MSGSLQSVVYTLYRKCFRNENSLIGIIFNWLLSIPEIAPSFTKVNKERLISENAFRSMENLDDFFTAMKLQLIQVDITF